MTLELSNLKKTLKSMDTEEFRQYMSDNFWNCRDDGFDYDRNYAVPEAMFTSY